MRRNVSYISHEGISEDRERGRYVPMKKLFRTRDAHRKSHQGAIKSARRRIVLTLRLSWLFHAFANAASAMHTSVETR